MPNKTVISNFNAIEENNTLIYDTRSISKIFRKFLFKFSGVSSDEASKPSRQYNLQSVSRYDSRFTISDDFCLNNISDKKFLEIWQILRALKRLG